MLHRHECWCFKSMKPRSARVGIAREIGDERIVNIMWWMVVVAALFVGCAPIVEPTIPLRIKADGLSELVLSDLRGAPFSNLRRTGFIPQFVEAESSADIVLRYRFADANCVDFASTRAGILQWERWQSVPASVTVVTGCTQRGFNQAMSHALLHGAELAVVRRHASPPTHTDGANAILRSPAESFFRADGEGTETVYGGTNTSETVTTWDLSIFSRL